MAAESLALPPGGGSRPGGGTAGSSTKDISSMLAMLQTCGATGQPVNFEVLRLLNDVDLQKAAVATFGEEAQAELREQLNKCLMSQSTLCSVGPGGAQMLNPNSEEFAQLMMSITRAQAVSVANRSGTNMFLAPPAASPKPASVIDERGYIVAPPEPLFGVNEVVYASPASLASPASTATPAFAAAPAYGAAPAAAAAVVAAPRVVTLGQCQKTGWSEKLGGKKKNSWQRRWLELDVGTDETRRAGAPRSSLVLYYKASPMDKKPKGFIVLADCAVSTDVPDEGLFGREYVIGLTPTMGPKDDKAYKLAFTDRRERDSWLTAIENAVLYNRNLS